MATTSGANVLRWSALAFGIFYGFSHQSAIFSSDKKAAVKHEWDRKQKLIDEAKAKYAEKTAPPASTQGKGDVITNPDDPKFDLEKYLNMVAKDSS